MSRKAIQKMPSYSVRCIFEWPPRDRMVLAHLYEERITLWKAAGIDEAIELAEAEAEKYASENGFQYLEFAQAFWLFSEVDADGIEVFSLLRESNMAAEHYLNIFQDTGYERST